LAWQIEVSETAKKQLAKIDHQAQRDIWRFLQDRIATDEDPMRFGAPLRKNLSGLWKYRVGNYRLICDIQGNRLIVLVVRVGHRREVYQGKVRLAE
jgi:mRNA interferase RelE/StbE